MGRFTFAIAAFLVAISQTNAQTYTTGNITFFSNNYSGKIDVTNPTVTLTLTGPSTSWLGLGFNAATMDAIGMDAVIFDGTNLTDRTFDGIGNTPPLDAIQNWTVTSNTIASGVRTVVATRARDTGDVNDYVFPASAQSLNLVYARRPNSLAIAYHGGGNCGATIVSFTLGIDDFALAAFKLYPNPSLGGYATVALPNGINEAKVFIYDFLGRVISNGILSATENKFDTSNLQKGSYIIKVSTDEGSATKTLVVN